MSDIGSIRAGIAIATSAIGAFGGRKKSSERPVFRRALEEGLAQGIGLVEAAKRATQIERGRTRGFVPSSPAPTREGRTGFGVPIPEIFRRGLLDIIQASVNRPFPGGAPGGRVGGRTRTKSPRERKDEELRKIAKRQAEAQRKEQRRKPPGQLRKERREARERRGRELAERIDQPGVRRSTQQVQVAGPRRTAGQIRRSKRVRTEQPTRDLPPLPGRGPSDPGGPLQGPPSRPDIFQGPPQRAPEKPAQAPTQGRLEEISVQATRRPAPLEEIKVSAKRRTLPTGSPAPTRTPSVPRTVPRSVQLGILAATTALAGRSQPAQRSLVIQGQQFAPTPTPTPTPAPQTTLAPAPAGARVRSGQGRCEKRARKNRKTCWRGFYEEFPNRTSFTKWEKVNCATRKRIK